MDKFNAKINSSKTKVFYMFMMFMWIGRASPYTGFNISENPILMPVYLAIIGYYYLNFCKKSIKPLLLLLSVLAVWSFAIFIKFGNLDNYSFQFIYYLVIVHVAFNLYSLNEYLFLFEDILVKLSLLSLLVWILVNVFPATVVPFMHSIAVFENKAPMETTSVLVGIGTSFEMGLRRNIGFSWEPGIFACFVALGLYVNLIRNKFKIFPFIANKNFYILLLTLFSTLSTTGYMSLLVICFFYMLNRSISSKVMVLMVIVLIFPTVAGFSFMSDKILGLMNIDEEIAAVNYWGSQGRETVCPQRFSGFVFEWFNFIHDFWFGYGHYSQSYTSTVLFGNVNVAVSNGILYILAKYGVLVGAFFYYWMIRSSVFLSKSLNYKGTYIFALLFTLLGFSYDFWENNIMMFFYLSTFYMACSKSYSIKWNS